jgi:Zn finger protein HypA/HybF involved in hydrogenase expression
MHKAVVSMEDLLAAKTVGGAQVIEFEGKRVALRCPPCGERFSINVETARDIMRKQDRSVICPMCRRETSRKRQEKPRLEAYLGLLNGGQRKREA